MIKIKEIRITIWSKWNGLVTEREVLDKDGDLITPLKERKIDSCKVFVCWDCKGCGSSADPFARAGRIEDRTCSTCGGSGRVVLDGNSRIDAFFDSDKISVIWRYETEGDYTEVVETPWSKVKPNPNQLLNRLFKSENGLGKDEGNKSLRNEERVKKIP